MEVSYCDKCECCSYWSLTSDFWEKSLVRDAQQQVSSVLRHYLLSLDEKDPEKIEYHKQRLISIEKNLRSIASKSRFFGMEL